MGRSRAHRGPCRPVRVRFDPHLPAPTDSSRWQCCSAPAAWQSASRWPTRSSNSVIILAVLRTWCGMYSAQSDERRRPGAGDVAEDPYGTRHRSMRSVRMRWIGHRMHVHADIALDICLATHRLARGRTHPHPGGTETVCRARPRLPHPQCRLHERVGLITAAGFGSPEPATNGRLGARLPRAQCHRPRYAC